MTTYKITISYIGVKYEGWQIQPEPHLTIQGTLNKALEKIFKSKEIYTLGSGRTDSGVHALMQVVKLNAPFLIPPDSLKMALNSHLPQDIRILSIKECTDFHPTKDACNKTYSYLFYKGDYLPPFLEGRATLIKNGLDWEAMKSVSNNFIGEHDFINFSTKGTLVSTTVRTVTKIEFQSGHCALGDLTLSSDQIEVISFTGTGFLKQMVRLLVGSLIEVGKGKVSGADIEKHLTSEATDKKIGPVAPAQGLYLKNVVYEA